MYNEYEHMTLQDWLITLLILCVPCVNIVMIFVWAFGSNVNPSKKTFFQAYLIFMAVITVLYLIFIFGLAAIGASSYNMISMFA